MRKPSYWNKAKKYLSKKDKVMKKLILTYKDVTLTTRRDIFYSLVKAVCGQQVSTKSADAIFNRLKIRCKGKINPKVINALIKLGDIAKIKNSSEEGFVNYFYNNLVSEHNNNFKIKDLIIFKILPESIRKEIIKIIIEKNSNYIQINKEHIYKIDELLCSDGSKYYDLPNNIKFAKEYNMANFEKKKQV